MASGPLYQKAVSDLVSTVQAAIMPRHGTAGVIRYTLDIWNFEKGLNATATLDAQPDGSFNWAVLLLKNPGSEYTDAPRVDYAAIIGRKKLKRKIGSRTDRRTEDKS